MISGLCEGKIISRYEYSRTEPLFYIFNGPEGGVREGMFKLLCRKKTSKQTINVSCQTMFFL